MCVSVCLSGFVNMYVCLSMHMCVFVCDGVCVCVFVFVCMSELVSG